MIINYLQDHYAEDYKLHLAAQVAIIALTLVAIIFCAMSWSGVLAAHWQMQSVKKAYKRRKTEFKAQGYPRPFGKKRNHWLGSFNAFVFPFAMMALWLLFLVAQFYQFNWLWSNEEKFKRDSVSKEAQLNRSVSEIAETLKSITTKLNDVKPTVGTKGMD